MGGATAERIEGQGGAMACVCYLLWPCWGTARRGKFREHYGIDGSTAADCCVATICPTCNVIQQDNESLVRGTNAARPAPAAGTMS